MHMQVNVNGDVLTIYVPTDEEKATEVRNQYVNPTCPYVFLKKNARQLDMHCAEQCFAPGQRLQACNNAPSRVHRLY